MVQVTQTEKQLPAKVSELDAIASLVVQGDLSKLNDQQKTVYYMEKCKAIGVPWQIGPYDYLDLGGKIVLYLNKIGCSYLAKEHGISCEIIEEKEVLDGRAYMVKVKATIKESGRSETATKYLALEYQKFNWKTNQNGKKYKELLTHPDGSPIMLPLPLEGRLGVYMKAETQAKNRAIKALTGEGGIDDDENAGLGMPVVISEEKHVHQEATARLAAKAVEEGRVIYTEVKADEETGEVISYEAEPERATQAERYNEEAKVAQELGNTELAEKKKALAKATQPEKSKLFAYGLSCGFSVAEINEEMRKQFKTTDIDTDQLEELKVWLDKNRRK